MRTFEQFPFVSSSHELGLKQRDNVHTMVPFFQVIQCHSFDKQLRVRAKIDDGTGRISMPSNYPIQVFYKEGDIEGK